jgi:hypothetical protein
VDDEDRKRENKIEEREIDDMRLYRKSKSDVANYGETKNFSLSFSF